MFILSRKMVHAGVTGCASRTVATYEDAIKALNGLQSNAAYLRNVKKHDYNSNDNLEETRKYIVRSGISLDQLDKLSVIHVAGTKGKGSACAFTDVLLRAHGVRTGLYTSPHLVSVRERLRINGKPIDEEKFTEYFWKLYKTLDNQREYDNDMPPYFKFLTILMFHIFLREPIDVAIIEVGIGGEHDCTNVVRNPVCVGITSLGLDHTKLLGNTLDAIAYQKSGIFKKGTLAFSVPQPEEAMRVIEKRAKEKDCSLQIVSTIGEYSWPNGKSPVLGISGDFQSYNASIAIRMAQTWIKSKSVNEQILFSFNSAALALSTCKWPGRLQIFHGDGIDFHLDGAHTLESLEFCASWFAKSTRDCTGKRVLVFNTTGDRDSIKLLSILRSLNFHRVFFVPNIAGKLATVDQINYTVSSDEAILRCRKHRNIWGDGAVCVNTVSDVLDEIKEEENLSNARIQMLVTGSLHLVGSMLAIIDPDLSMSMKI